MRFTPTSNWLQASTAAFRVVTWSMEVKKTTSLADALTAGTWIDISKYLNDSFFPITQKIEFSVGQFTADSISVTAAFNGIPGIPSVSAIQYFKDTIFNASASEYLEVKVKASIGISSSSMSTDNFYAFTGFIDKAEVTTNERGDTVQFNVFTADELGNRISALNVNTQYYNADVDGASTPGITLPRIKGMYVTNAAITGKELQVGQHTIEYVSILHQVKLDDGDYATLSGSNEVVTLANKADTQRVTLYISAADLESSTEAVKDYVIVIAKGTTLPRQPYYGISIGQYFKNLYSVIGIATTSLTTLDNLKINSWDGTARISYYDVPPNNVSVTGGKYAIAFDGTYIWVGVGNKLYRRLPTTEEYELKATLTAGLTILKLIYNAHHSELWIAASSTSTRTKADTIVCYWFSGDLSNELTLTNSAGLHTINVIDYNYAGASYHYALLVCESSLHTIAAKEIISDFNTTTISIATINSNTTTEEVPQTGFGCVTDSGKRYVWCDIDVAVGVGIDYRRSAYINGAGSWVVDTPTAMTVTTGEPFARYDAGTGFWKGTHIAGGVYVPATGIIYYWTKTSDYSVTPVSICYSPELAVTTLSVGLGFTADYAPNTNSAVIAGETNTFYYSSSGHVANQQWKLFRHYDPTGSGDTNTELGNVKAVHGSLMYNSGTSTLFGIDSDVIFQYSTVINLYTRVVFGDVSVKSAITDLLKAFNLIGTISANKTAYVYRRGDASGVIQTSGNNLILNKTNITDVTRIENAYQKIALVEVTNGTTTATYDGTNFGVSVISSAKKLTLSSSAIPDNIVADLAKYIFAFYNADHDVYQFQTNIASMEYEVMDGCSVTLNDTRIQKTATGLIQKFGFDQHGNVNVEVLF